VLKSLFLRAVLLLTHYLDSTEDSIIFAVENFTNLFRHRYSSTCSNFGVENLGDVLLSARIPVWVSDIPFASFWVEKVNVFI